MASPLEQEAPQASITQSASSSTINNDDDLTPETSEKREEGLQYAPIRVASARNPLDGQYVPIQAGDPAELYRLASSMSRTISRTKSYTPSRPGALARQDTLAGVESGDPILDPSNADFDVYKWARMFMRTQDEENIKTRRAGFTFRNLHVSGSGAALQLQKNVASILMAPLRLGEYFSFGKKTEKKILRSFDGVVKEGEMLVVLGRPGSGCTTFLKTISGELTGLDLDKQSVIHYNGRLHAVLFTCFADSGDQVLHRGRCSKSSRAKWSTIKKSINISRTLLWGRRLSSPRLCEHRTTG